MSNTVIALPGARQVAPTGMATSQATVVEQSRAVAEVQAAVVVAQSNPRDVDRAIADMRDTCGRLPVANRAFYAVPNRGSGLSVHLMRELARIWGNTDHGVRELRRDDDAGVSEVQAWAWDQQTNTRSTRSFIQPHQRMKGKERQNLVDLNDIYLTNQNTGARAVRECISSVLPDWFIAEAQAVCEATLQNGEGKSVEERSREAATAFANHGVTRAQLEDYVKAKYGKWTPAMLADLQRVYVSITQDGIAATEFFTAAPVRVEPEKHGAPQTPQGAAPSGTTQGVAAPGATEVEGQDAQTSDAPRPADTTPPEPHAAPDAATARQVAAINIALNARGVGNKGTGDQRRDAKLAWLTEATGRRIESSKYLTKAEAGTLLDHFAAEDAAKPNALPAEPEPFPND
ncbi:hypothetical protein [Promicromonospora iranensis]|uniref:Uncharacterized protein n=1 Tax=Promicromonospora iranensis TaxID=1105144 RepID=A0ABU2CV71_9MICO|nr:hypothetical protein [Promicromonospora iranensis]MDR7385239.1 hypothetical protein [Promicromonospora iranensis]